MRESYIAVLRQQTSFCVVAQLSSSSLVQHCLPCSIRNSGPPSVSPEPECVVVSPPPTEEARPQIKVGDYASVHSRDMGSSHLPCRVVGEFDGRYQLYCSKGVLDTTFSRAEVMAKCTPMAPKVSLRSVTSDSAMIEHCNCQIPVCSEDTDITEEEHEAPGMWEWCLLYVTF